jgi:hypothetical protein
MTTKRPSERERDDGLPSNTVEPGWIRTSNPQAQELTPYCGKWLLYVREQFADEVWSRVAAATNTGRLGVSAKIATKGSARGDPPEYVCCVYTYDCRDRDDVARVLIELRALGSARRLSYKEDNATYALRYGRGAALYVAQPRETTFTQRRPIIEPPTCSACGKIVQDLNITGIELLCSDCRGKSPTRKRKARK